MNLIELEKQIKETKVIEKFKDGVVDGLIHGMRDENQSHHYYNLGYDFGVNLHSRQVDGEVTPLWMLVKVVENFLIVATWLTQSKTFIFVTTVTKKIENCMTTYGSLGIVIK